MKTIIKNVKIRFLSCLAAVVLIVVFKTLRWKFVGFDKISGMKQVILAFWHGRILMLPGIYDKALRSGTERRVTALISQHGDGRMIASAVKMLKVDSVAGSSTRGGARGLLGLLTQVKAGSDIGITPDGPRGPIWEVKPGIIHVAQTTGLPILPFTYSAQKYWTFGSWDKMILPKPFSKAVAMLGEPFYVSKDLDEQGVEAARLELQRKLIEFNAQADDYDYSA